MFVCWGTALLEFSTILTRKRPIGRISSLRLRDVQLHDVAIMKLMIMLDSLAVEDPRAPDPRRFERMLEIPMDFPGQIKNGASQWKRERLCQIRRPAGHFCIDAHHTQ